MPEPEVLQSKDVNQVKENYFDFYTIYIRIKILAATPQTVSHLEVRLKGSETCTPVWGPWPRWGWRQAGPRGTSSWDKDDISSSGARGSGRWRPGSWTPGARALWPRGPRWFRARAPGPGPRVCRFSSIFRIKMSLLILWTMICFKDECFFFLVRKTKTI